MKSNNKYSIYLRALEIEDYKITHKWRLEDELWDNKIGAKRYVSSETERRWIERTISEHEKGEKYTFGICNKEDDLIGIFRLSNLDYVNRNCESTILIDKNHRNGSVFDEAHNIGIEYAFEQLGMHKIIARIVSTNKASLIACFNFGFEKEGVLKEQAYKNGNFVDLICIRYLNKNKPIKYE